jgi:hypothetical protein
MRLAPEAPAHSTSLRILPLFYSKKALNDEREIPVKSLRHYPFGSEYDCNRADDGSASKNSASKNLKNWNEAGRSGQEAGLITALITAR